MSSYLLCEFKLQKVKSGCLAYSPFVEENMPNGLGSIASRLGVTLGVLPEIFTKIHELEEIQDFSDSLYDLEESALNAHPFELEEREEWLDVIERFSHGVISLEEFTTDSDEDCIYSGYGKLACVVKNASVNWHEDEFVVCGEYALTLVSTTPFDDVMIIEWETMHDPDFSDSELDTIMKDFQPELFLERLVDGMNESQGFPLMVSSARMGGLHALSMGFTGDEECDELIDIDINVRFTGENKCTVALPSFAHLLYSENKGLVENADRLYTHLIDDLTNQGCTVTIVDNDSEGYALGSSFRQLYWCKGEPIPNSIFTDKTRNLSPTHLAEHLKNLSVVNFARNGLFSMYSGEQLVYGVTGFDEKGAAVAHFQIEFYSDSGNEEYKSWMESLFAEMGLSGDDFTALNDWEFTWHTDAPFVPEDLIFDVMKIYCKFPQELVRNIQVLTLKLICDGFDNTYNMSCSQEPLKWFFSEIIEEMGLKSQVLPLFLIPDVMEDVIPQALTNMLKVQSLGFPLSDDDLLGLSSITQELTADALQKRKGASYFFTVYVIVECNQRELIDLLNATTRNLELELLLPDAIAGNRESFIKEGNLPIFLSSLKPASEFYHLSNLTGAYLSTNLEQEFI